MHLPAPQPFKLDIQWLQAQAFRWCEGEDGWYYGFVKGHLIKVCNSGDGIEFCSDGPEESLAADVRSYFRLDQDIEPVHDALRGVGLGELVDKYDGMRILRQDPWECLVAYICSQRNDIDGITKILNKLACRYGEPVTLGGVTCNSFPSPKRLAKVGKTTLEGVDLGLSRGSRIHEVAEHTTEGTLDLSALARWPHRQARGFLMSYEGIGPKIADCVCLFSLDKAEAFPVDTHIGKALEDRYGQTYRPGAKNAGLMRWVSEYFGEHAGYAGQLLFLEQRLGMTTPFGPTVMMSSGPTRRS